MIYNLFLNSKKYNSASSAVSRGQRVYAIDWSFLPENKAFNLTFKFLSQHPTLVLSSNNISLISASFGPLALSCSGGSVIQRQNSNIIGSINVRSATANSDFHMFSTPIDNPPITLLSRPSNNLLEITITDIDMVQVPLDTDYILTLSFEEVKNK